jgi:hypothetical protein
MMEISSLHGRRIHIAASNHKLPEVASAEEIGQAREFVKLLVIELMKEGCSFVVPVDSEPLRDSDSQPICYDWLVWETLYSNLHLRPASAPLPLAVAVQHHKSENQIPAQFAAIWDGFKGSAHVSTDNAAHWNMNSKRMEIQASRGDILITLGGCEGVLYLANLYHQAGKPVIPLDFKLCDEQKGSRRLFNQAMARQETSRFFQTTAQSPHDWINRLNFASRHDAALRVERLIEMLRALKRPSVFAVRLLNDDHQDFAEVQEFFSEVAAPVIERQLGYRLVTINRKHVNEYARIDEEIFTQLHHSSAVVADITGGRPNCFIELGYALGRSIPTIMTGRKGSENPFDTNSIAGHFWKTDIPHADRQAEFLEHWMMNINRPPLVKQNLLVP